MNNTEVVNSTSKYIVKSTGIGFETDKELVDAEKLIEGTDGSKVSLIECYYIIESIGSTAGKLTISAASETESQGAGRTVVKPLTLTNSGKYGLRPEQLKFGNDRQFTLTTDSNVRNYLLVTEFRRN